MSKKKKEVKKVIAIESLKDGVMKTYGEGVLLEGKIPDKYPFNKAKIENPCIKLDSGDYVWGFQCWWGEVNAVREKYKKEIVEEITVSIESIKPL